MINSFTCNLKLEQRITNFILEYTAGTKASLQTGKPRGEGGTFIPFQAAKGERNMAMTQ